MDDNSGPVSLFSTTTARTLWTILIAFAGFVLALNVWGWARRGYDWTAFLGPVGMLLLVASFPIARSRGRLYLLLQVIAIGLLSANMVLIFRRW